MRSDLARWDELPAQSCMTPTRAGDGLIHNPGTNRPVSDIAAGGLLLTIQLVSLSQKWMDTVWEKSPQSDQEESKLWPWRTGQGRGQGTGVAVARIRLSPPRRLF